MDYDFDFSTGAAANPDWVDPDRLWADARSAPFIFGGGVRWHDRSGGATHHGYVNAPAANRGLNKAQLRRSLEDDKLVGRVDGDRRWCSFWNERPEPYALLAACLRWLLAEGMVDERTTVSAPGFRNLTVAAALAEGPAAAPAPEAGQRRDLHLLRGDEKREALRAVGVAGGRARPWAGAARPGQKWWAPHSEGVDRFERHLRQALDAQ